MHDDGNALQARSEPFGHLFLGRLAPGVYLARSTLHDMRVRCCSMLGHARHVMHDIALSCAAFLYMCRYIRPKHIEPGAVPAMEPDAVPAIPGLTFERPLRLVNEAGYTWMPPEKKVGDNTFVGFWPWDSQCYKFCTGHTQAWGKKDKDNRFGVPWFYQEMQAARCDASKQKWKDFNQALQSEIDDAREVVGNSTKRRRIRPARPGDDALCGEVIEVVLRHGADVRVVRCLFGLRKQDRVFIEGTQENITFVVRAIKSDYESGRMTGKKWKSRDAENADAAAHDDDDDCETQPEHEGEHE